MADMLQISASNLTVFFLQWKSYAFCIEHTRYLNAHILRIHRWKRCGSRKQCYVVLIMVAKETCPSWTTNLQAAFHLDGRFSGWNGMTLVTSPIPFVRPSRKSSRAPTLMYSGRVMNWKVTTAFSLVWMPLCNTLQNNTNRCENTTLHNKWAVALSGSQCHLSVSN